MQKRVIMISGANRGIGLAIAKALYAEEHCLSLGIRQQNKELHGLVSSWDSNKVYVAQYESRDNESAKLWVKGTLEQFGQIDVLINCAGIHRPCGIDNFNEEILDELWQVNTKAPVYLTSQVWEYLKHSGTGRVINIVSLAGKRTSKNGFGYSMSKHALLAFTHGIRQAGWDYGIRATAICPGWVDTDMAGICSLPKDKLTKPEDIGILIKILLNLPNTASVAELLVNCECEQLF